MTNELHHEVRCLPQKPGVYVFSDDKKKILYIGKAKKLKNRVKSYFQKNRELTPSKQFMVSKIASIDFTVTDTENEALLLETSLIQKHKPPYNIMLKDDKYWQYIVIDKSGIWTQLKTVRRPEFNKKSDNVYFGPYTSGQAVKETIRTIKKIFPICLKPPREATPKNPKPCFNYHLGRCAGPCMGSVSPEDYSTVFDEIKQFIQGSRSDLIAKLKHKMKSHSDRQNFEAAGRVRDQIIALEKLDNKQKVVINTTLPIDIASTFYDGCNVSVNLFKIRDRKLTDKINTIIKNPHLTECEILEAFLEKYYSSTTDTPKQIIVGNKSRIQKTVLNIPITVAMRGKKAQLIKMGAINAKEYLDKKINNLVLPIKKNKSALNELKHALSLKKVPYRIETYDISNIYGKFAVGAMVVMENGLMKSSDYRKFKIKTLNTPDDPRMMAEMLERRLLHIVAKHSKNEISNKPTKNHGFDRVPDLIVIDGGRTQLNASLKILNKLGLRIPIIGLAKREEEIYTTNNDKLIKLDKSSLALKLLMLGRDEAHRFGITYHRATRNKASLESVLDTIPGIGQKTRSVLLKEFGSVDKIKSAPAHKLNNLIGPHKTSLIRKNIY